MGDKLVKVATVAPREYAVVEYRVIGVPPLKGAGQDTAMFVLRGLPTIPVTVSGTAIGMATDAFDGCDGPTEFVATTVNEYATPFVKPVNTSDVSVPGAVAVACWPAAVAVTV